MWFNKCIYAFWILPRPFLQYCLLALWPSATRRKRTRAGGEKIIHFHTQNSDSGIFWWSRSPVHGNLVHSSGASVVLPYRIIFIVFLSSKGFLKWYAGQEKKFSCSKEKVWRWCNTSRKTEDVLMEDGGEAEKHGQDESRIRHNDRQDARQAERWWCQL